jgi:uncharacterized protein (DUF1501 family)
MDRRDFVRQLALIAGGAVAIPVGLSGCAVAPITISDAKHGDPMGEALNRPHANGDGNPRLVVMFLRGAVDGLNVVVPHGDPEYYQARPTIAVARPGAANGAIDLTGYFGLHPAMQSLHPYWLHGQLAFVHASGSPDPSRSHFDAQDFMETGTPGRKLTPDGWMNRLLGAMQADHASLRALNVGETVPRILSGQRVVASVATGRNATRPTSIDQAAVNQAFGALYANNDALGNAYRSGVSARQELMTDLGAEQRMANNGAPLPNGLSIDTARLGNLMRQDPRIRLGFLSAGGWDTHVNQGNGAGQLANRLKPLCEGLDTLAKSLGPAFNDTVIVVMSEFGRTFRENGNGGTDHGHGNAMWLLGGNVRGRAIYGDWPGLNQAALNEGRDLAVTTDFRSVLAVLAERHLRLPDAVLAQVFPSGPGPGRVARILV